MRIIFAFSLDEVITTQQTVLFIAQLMLLFGAICFNYMSYKYEDYSKVDGALIMINAFSLLWILSMKLCEDFESALSPEFMNIALLANGNIITITTIFINTVCQKMKLTMVAVSVVLLYTFALIHQFGFKCINSDILEGGFDGQGVFLLIIVLLLVIFKISYFVKKFEIEEAAVK